LPFAIGERATYEVDWLGGPLNVPAGTIALEVASPTPEESASLAGARLSLIATADTAAWVSRFFEAHDRFRTITDEALRPLAHVREIREGRRRMDRVFFYDHAKRRVRIGETLSSAKEDASQALPFPAGARDVLAALWYARSLPLAPGFRVDVPISEAGQRLTVGLSAQAEESIVTPAGTFSAFKVVPNLSAATRRQVEATVWITSDTRRLPVVVDLAAGFAHLRVKLVDYRR
jgi:hypothetical protein